MTNQRIYNLTKTAITCDNTDYLVIDSVDNGTQKILAENFLNQEVVQETPNSIISGTVDSNGNANILGYVGNAVSFATSPAITIVDYARNKVSLTTVPALTIASAPVSSTFNMFLGTDASSESYTQAVFGKDLYVDFSQANANDNYGLHSVTTIGSPTYTGNKFNSNGSTGLQYNITDLEVNAWCVQGKFNFTNMTAAQNIIEKYAAPSTGDSFVLRRTATGILNLWLSSNGTSWDITTSKAGTKVYANTTDYYIRLRFTGTNYYVDWSTDYNPLTGTGTWTTDITVTSSVITFRGISKITFGYSVGDSTYPLVGTMDDLQVTIGSPTCAIKNKYQIQKATPLYPVTNDIWFDTSIEPAVQKKYNGSTWATYTKVPCGQALTNASGAVSSVVQPLYANNKSDVKLVESYSSGASWYRKYSDGWIEQGGSGNIVSGGYYGRVNFITPFISTNYFATACIVTASEATTNNGYVGVSLKTISSATFTLNTNASANANLAFYWYAVGY